MVNRFDYIFEKNTVVVHQCFFEADTTCAILANKMNAFCVISSDSDFFIYKIPGFIHTSLLDISYKENDDGYSISNIFAVHLTPFQIAKCLQVSPVVLPIFAFSQGNDYSDGLNYTLDLSVEYITQYKSLEDFFAKNKSVSRKNTP